MKPKTVILLVVAVGCGLVASYMTSRVIADRSAAPPEAVKVPIVYAIKNVPANQILNNPAEFFEVRQVPEEMVPKGRPIRDLNQLAKKRLVNPIGLDKFVSEDDLLGTNDAGLTYRIPPGMRAVSVRVSQDTSVAGFVLPGYHVDIMCVPNGRTECNTILQRVQVLAINALVGRPDDGKQNLETHIVTFAVSPDDANKLALATFSGNLRLSLRNIDDDKTAAARSATGADLSRPAHDPSDPVLQSNETAPTAPGGQPVPSVPTNTVAEPEPPKPQAPKVLWVMKGRNGAQVVAQKYFDEQPEAVEVSSPDEGDDAPQTPVKKSEKPTGKRPTESDDDAPMPAKKDGKK